ncbi:MAG: hypothetical protein M1272_02675 [Firmicutes bacterium]|nr:hypothetical protein [Bacillota bacterium]
MTKETDYKELGALFQSLSGRHMSTAFHDGMLDRLRDNPSRIDEHQSRRWMGGAAVGAAALVLAVAGMQASGAGAPPLAIPRPGTTVARGMPSTAQPPTTSTTGPAVQLGGAAGRALPTYVAWHDAAYEVLYNSPSAPNQYTVPPSKVGAELGYFRTFSLRSIAGQSSAKLIAVDTGHHTLTEAQYAFPLTFEWRGRTYQVNLGSPHAMTQTIGARLGTDGRFAIYAVPGARSQTAIAIHIAQTVYVVATR